MDILLIRFAVLSSARCKGDNRLCFTSLTAYLFATYAYSRRICPFRAKQKTKNSNGQMRRLYAYVAKKYALSMALDCKTFLHVTVNTRKPF